MVADEHLGTVSWSQMWTSPGWHLSPQMKESQDPERERCFQVSWRLWRGSRSLSPVFWVFPGWAGFLRPLELAPGWLEPSSAVTRLSHWFLWTQLWWLFPSCSLGLQEQSLFPGAAGLPQPSRCPRGGGLLPGSWVLSG